MISGKEIRNFFQPAQLNVRHLANNIHKMTQNIPFRLVSRRLCSLVDIHLVGICIDKPIYLQSTACFAMQHM